MKNYTFEDYKNCSLAQAKNRAISSVDISTMIEIAQMRYKTEFSTKDQDNFKKKLECLGFTASANNSNLYVLHTQKLEIIK